MPVSLILNRSHRIRYHNLQHIILENITRKIANLDEKSIDISLVASNYVIDAFTTAAFSINITDEKPIVDFDKIPFVKALIGFTTPSVRFLLAMHFPYGGEILDALGLFTYPKDSMDFFEKCCTEIIRHDLVVFNKDYQVTDLRLVQEFTARNHFEVSGENILKLDEKQILSI